MELLGPAFVCYPDCSITDQAAGFLRLLSAAICMFDDEYFEIGDFDMVTLNHP